MSLEDHFIGPTQPVININKNSPNFNRKGYIGTVFRENKEVYFDVYLVGANY